MALQNDLRQYRVDYAPSFNAGAAQVSDAYHRGYYGVHSIHIKNPGAQTVTVQISNMNTPAEGTDVDWITVDTSTASKLFQPTVQFFRWIRFKVSGGASAAEVHSLSSMRLNS